MKNVKLGVCDWGLPGSGLYATRIAHKAGLDALSLRTGLYENGYPITFDEMIDIYLDEQQKYPVEYVAVALNDFDNIPMHARENTPEYDIIWDLLKRILHVAKKLGVSIIQVPGFGKSEVRSEEDKKYSAKALQFLCDKAGEMSMTVAYENLLAPEEFIKFSQMVDRENFKLYYDSQNYHLYRNYNQIDILNALYPYMCNQIHVKDGNGALSGSLLGTGDSGFFETIKALKQKNFEGYMIIENYYDNLPLRLADENPFELLRKDVQTLKKAVFE